MENFMDWHIFWTAAGVVVTLGTIMIGCFTRLTKQITSLTVRVDHLDDSVNIVSRKVDCMDQRLSKLEGAFEERGRWESKGVK